MHASSSYSLSCSAGIPRAKVAVVVVLPLLRASTGGKGIISFSTVMADIVSHPDLSMNVLGTHQNLSLGFGFPRLYVPIERINGISVAGIVISSTLIRL